CRILISCSVACSRNCSLKRKKHLQQRALSRKQRRRRHQRPYQMMAMTSSKANHKYLPDTAALLKRAPPLRALASASDVAAGVGHGATAQPRVKNRIGLFTAASARRQQRKLLAFGT